VPCWQAAAGPRLEAATEGAGPLLPFSPPLALIRGQSSPRRGPGAGTAWCGMGTLLLPARSPAAAPRPSPPHACRTQVQSLACIDVLPVKGERSDAVTGVEDNTLSQQYRGKNPQNFAFWHSSKRRWCTHPSKAGHSAGAGCCAVLCSEVRCSLLRGVVWLEGSKANY